MMDGRERDIPTFDIASYVRGSPGRKPSARASLAQSLMLVAFCTRGGDTVQFTWVLACGSHEPFEIDQSNLLKLLTVPNPGKIAHLAKRLKI